MNTKTFYHTQESRFNQLTAPIKCIRSDAWLGDAIYFWREIEDAEDWGNNSKRGKKYYEIYHSEIDIENVLDTVFNEEHYYFWFTQVEKVARAIIAKTKMKPTIKELNDYFKEKGVWDDVHGIMFQDLPTNPNKLLIKPIEYKAGKKKIIFPYRKRIQLAVYNSDIIITFAFLKRDQCI